MKKIVLAASLLMVMSQSASAQYGAAIEAAGALMQAAAASQAAEAARQAAEARNTQYRNSPRVVYRDRRVASPKTVYKTRTVYKSSKAHVASQSSDGGVVRASGRDPFASGSKGAEKFQ